MLGNTCWLAKVLPSMNKWKYMLLRVRAQEFSIKTQYE
jgi:hypothetical protein